MVSKLLKRLANRSASSSGEGGPLAEQTAEQTAELQTAELETAELESLSLKSLSRPGPPASPLPSAWVRMHVWRRDRGGCVRCGSRARVWFDYIVPIWEGGSITEQNIQLLCEACRRDKSASRWRKRWRA
jgi:HNH endonuclease